MPTISKPARLVMEKGTMRNQASNPRPIWTPLPDRVTQAAMTAFRDFAAERAGETFPDTPALHAWSLRAPGAFWDAVWDFFAVPGEKGARGFVSAPDMSEARFFPDAHLNMAEVLLTGGQGFESEDAIVFADETCARRCWSWGRLRREVASFRAALAAAGVNAGDRVAGLLPNIPEAVAAMLATLSLGAVWSSASPDFGVRGVLDRFGQISPKVLITADGYHYSGKRIELTAKLAELQPFLPSVTCCVVVDHLGGGEAAAARIARGITWERFTAWHAGAPLTFDRLPFDQPALILYSSGTTGVPKCILHRAGVVLQHLKELGLHADVQKGDRLFFYTTLGWMMWNWLASALGQGATILLYDGSPFHPRLGVLWDLAERERATHFGTSPKYLDTLRKKGFRPDEGRNIGALRTVLSTGAPLPSDAFDFVHASIEPDLHLASISGGTDILSCFVLGDPTRPVWRGEIQGPGLGLAVEVRQPDGSSAAPGERGELVCAAPFPAMPLGFWGDVDRSRYHAAYFERIPGIWCQGDFAEVTSHGGFVIHGRSDATLNPGGVRIGTAEIYAEVEKIPEVVDCVAVGQDWEGDVRVVLFVALRAGAVLDEALIAGIKARIRQASSPRHVPARILAVPDIPRTRTGKVSELAVRDVVHGRPVQNFEALANPEALEHFHDLPQLRI
jgi:acetoacetyl-CoA synthetase